MNTQYWYFCHDCKAEFQQDDAMIVTIPGVPPENEPHCPDCNSPHLRESVRAMCSACGEVQVADEDDLCSECYTEICERHIDASRDPLR